MTTTQDISRDAIVNRLCEYIREQLPPEKADLIITFARRYYISTSGEDLIQRNMEDIYGALLSHWDFIFERQPGEDKVRVFNPDKTNEKWSSPHTIIEISHDDMPFLVDSIRMEINHLGFQIHFMIHIGGLKLLRDDQYHITGIVSLDQHEPRANSEAPIYIEIDHIEEPGKCEQLQSNIERILNDVRVVVHDWPKMQARVEEALVELEQTPPPLDAAEITESKDFLRWLMSNHFTFLGCRDYRLTGDAGNRALQLIPGTGLGVLSDETASKASRSYSELPPQARKLALSSHILIVAKTNTLSTVHRPAYTDYIGVKRFSNTGELIGERRIIGLFTSTAYHMSPRHIPFLRLKVANAMRALQYPPDSHNGKEAIHILETLPRDDLFQATQDELLELTRGILSLQERKQTRLFARKDSYGRYISCLLYLPRENFSTEVCNKVQDILLAEFQGIESSFSTYFSDSVLARIHFQVRVNPKKSVDYDLRIIEQKVIAVARLWLDELSLHLNYYFGESTGLKYYQKYARAFPISFTDSYPAREAVSDIEIMETLSVNNPLNMHFYKPLAEHPEALRLKLFNISSILPLSDVLPTLEHMGLRIIGERLHEINLSYENVWINDFDMVYVGKKNLDIKVVRDIFQEAFTKIWFGAAEDDGFNRLVLEAGLTWHETAMLRAYTKYLRQTGITFSQNYIESALVNNQAITENLVRLFKLRFDPLLPTEKHQETNTLVKQIEKALRSVTSLDEDRILRRILEVIMATLRTNFFQRDSDGKIKSYISYKINSTLIAELPLPKPKYEIFVYSPRVEGVHLRGGKVARGGIRWSDRREDFRTEVLGLMKAQQVKNALIVPVGAKGGFYPKCLPQNGDREAIAQEVVSAYSTFMRGLLDVTDNIKDDKIVYPVDVVRFDDDDPYLVVAADKGTATFSDIANNISAEYDFWLGDAFASGGSSGYDHKKMGITARGAWISVRRHFRELAIDPDNDDFTVVGIGDMSGDVFGNGMLLSRHIKLIAAYNHQHIFLDPDPDPEISFKERERLFNLPRSAWSDYNAELISKGGGVYARSLKSIKLTPEMKKALEVDKTEFEPNELIREMLRAPVTLIWNGGIGTFVKASYELQTDVGDRSNDPIRVDATELRARVIAEGGNLGMTQFSRIEYALHGGILFTDFVDNSAGVDCSDHEVNIKIALNKLIAKGEMTLAERNRLLETMGNEVAELVLRDNYEQTQMLSLEASVSLQTSDIFRRYMSELEKAGKLDRKLEFMPTEKIIMERKNVNKGLTRPEIAVLLSYGKMLLKQNILASDVPEDPYFVMYLKREFPAILCKEYMPAILEHSLRREIIATQVSRTITDHMGIYFTERLQRETGAPIAFIVRAYAIAETIFQTEMLWHAIEKLDYKVNSAVQEQMMLQIYYLIRRATRWFLRNRKPDLNIKKTIEDFSAPICELITKLPLLLTKNDNATLKEETHNYINAGVDEALAKQVASTTTLFTSLDIIETAGSHHFSLEDVAKTYYLLSDHFGFNWLREQLNTNTAEHQWDELARSSLRDDLDKLQSMLSLNVLHHARHQKQQSIEEKIVTWLEYYTISFKRWQSLCIDLKAGSITGFIPFSVMIRELYDFTRMSHAKPNRLLMADMQNVGNVNS